MSDINEKGGLLSGKWLWLVGVALLSLLVQYLTSRYYRLISQIPAAKAPRFIGHAIEFARQPKAILDIMTRIFEEPTANRKVVALWVGPFTFVYLRDLADIEKLLSCNTNLKKSENYSFLEPWLGNGLINSYGPTWQSHRKLITPTFHFKILENFLETMRKKSEILCEVLDKKVDAGYFNIEPYIANYTLDVISETAMSTTIDAQRKSSKFVECITSLTEIIIVRSLIIWYHFGLIFNLSAYGSLQRKSVAYVKDFITKILEKKKNETKEETDEIIATEDIGEKKRMALLDMLYDVQSSNPQFKDKELIDEVNTFMFAGYDTTTSGLSFVLHLLSVHQDVQEKVYNEIVEQLGEEKVSYKELMGLKYLERVLKESLRLYPSVPYIGRQLVEEMELSTGHIVPEKADVAIFIYNHHRNPEIWPEPERFDPERFLPENSVGRHPYAYIPFSAGSRNCIGQKFALMEMMLTVTELLRRYKLMVEPNFKIHPISHIVLRPDDEGVRLKLERR